MKYGYARRWSRSNSAFLGAFLGMMIAAAHQVHHALAGEIPNESPLAHIFLELVGLAAGTAILGAALAEIRNRRQ
ncbi:hypothetical protein [Microvirga roseola]|uniref:hypothetical protein n=1 Tax=Microvirga roseola TaxID=2883126 RepID=UPI001E46C6AD|nr:hypothetical protein [Microvirga roseola]